MFKKRFRAMMLQKLRPGHVAASIVFVLIPTLLITPRTVMAAVTSIGSVTSLTVSNDPTNSIQYDSTYTMPGGTALPAGISKLKCTKLMPTSQAYFGFGEYAGQSNRRGLNMICWNNQSYHWGDGQNPMYMNTPFFYGV